MWTWQLTALIMALMLDGLVHASGGAEALGRSCGTQATQSVPKSGGTLFSWGVKRWSLGRARGDHVIPTAVMEDVRVWSVAASRHSGFATVNGEVWTMGHNDSRGGGGHGSTPINDSGQLGRGGTQAPGVVMGIPKGKRVVQVVTGRYHTLALTEDGELYTWGLNDWGQLGRPAWDDRRGPEPARCTQGSTCHDGTPGLVEALRGVRLVGASAGRYNTLALDDTGRLHTWGYDGCASGGVLPQQGEAWRPRVVGGELAGKRVVAHDSGYVLWIAATSDGEVYTCNTQDDGYAGTLKTPRKPNAASELGRHGQPLVPGKVGGQLEGKRVKAVAAGREHCVVATDTGEVLSWGGSRMVGRTGPWQVPGRVTGALAQDQVLFVGAGEYFSIAASRSMVYGWGGNNYGSVGAKGNSNMVEAPVKVQGPIGEGGWTILGIAAGYQHSLAIAVKGVRKS